MFKVDSVVIEIELWIFQRLSSGCRCDGASVEDVELEIDQNGNISVVVAIFATVSILKTIEGD